MSSGKKHRLEGEVDAVQKVKKVKTDDPTAAKDAPVKEKKEKKDKKDKKDKSEKKKDKKEKKDKKDKKTKDKEQSDEQNGVEAAAAAAMDLDVPTDAPVDEQLTAKKEKKEKKDKKSKDKKDKKKDRRPDDEATAEPPVANGAPSKYQQTAALTAVPESEVKTFLENNYITIHDQTNPSITLRPVLKFSHLPTSRLLSKKPFGTFTTPTPIQAASWPFSLSGRDVVGIAETGSGKTYAFSLPCVEALLSLPKPTHSRIAPTRAVIVSPTRELAMQTHESTSSLASLVGLKAVCIYGGASKDDQRNLLRKGADIIVATPGRLKDFLSEGSISLSEAAFVVLDEADRMLDKGFEEDIKLIIGSCPAKEKRQTLMFTATWPSEVRGLAETFMVDPVKVIINKNKPGGETGDGNGNGTIELQANSRIAQTVEVVDPRGKERRLLEILKEAQRGKAHNDRVLVFCLYKKETTRVEQFLTSRGLSVCAIHGDLRQEQRTRSLEAFKAGTTTIMLATDVAARGLDIPEVKLVVNLTFPLTIEDYVHRIGRTGRAGKEGKAITLFTEHDKSHSGSLINVLKAAGQPVPEELMKFGTTVKKKQHDAYGAFFKDVDMSKKATKITFD
ncbi:putative atp-dependent rna helicase dbp-3 [Diaporthe ampelina]|uniref:RNA helicase n=1 Tax=Diaporthe ampelina TaxID=1214573 RepID=A0A0G2IGF5_9PEZI|nr:putative atp-dependent rna helicase dbp-3 [Diaporthe ampelina]